MGKEIANATDAVKRIVEGEVFVVSSISNSRELYPDRRPTSEPGTSPYADT